MGGYWQYIDYTVITWITTMKVKLTLPRIESAASPKNKNQDFIWDTQAKGLGLRITRNGTKSYVYQYRVSGKRCPIRETLGGITDLTLDEARIQVYNRILKPTPKDRNKSPTLRQVFDNYKMHKVGRSLSQKTADQYGYVLNLYAKDWLEKRVTDIKPDMVVVRHTDIGKQGTYAANYIFRILRALLNFAKAAYDELEDWTPPVYRLAKTKGLFPEKRRQTLLRGREIGLFFNSTLAHPYPNVRAYVLFRFLTGCRPEETSGLKWHDIHLDDRCFCIPDPKNRKPLWLPLGKFLTKTLNELKSNSDDWVFPSRVGNGQTPVSDIRKALTAICGRSGIKPIVPYDLRRTYATIADGLDLKDSIIKKLLHHQSGQNDVTQGYIVGEVERLREPQQRIETLILQIADEVLPKMDEKKLRYFDSETQTWETISPELRAFIYQEDERTVNTLFEDYAEAYPEHAK